MRPRPVAEVGGLVLDEHGDRLNGGLPGPDQDVGQVEHAQSVEGAEEDGDGESGLDQRQSDAGEAPPGVRAVDLGGLVDLIGNGAGARPG